MTVTAEDTNLKAADEAVRAGSDEPTAEELAAKASLAAGFNRVNGEEAVTEEEPNTEDDTPAASAPAEGAAAAQAAEQPVDVQVVVKGALDQLEHRLRSDFGRQLAAMKTAGKDAAKEAAATGAAAPDAKQIDAAAKAGGEKWTQLAEDFPDWAAALEERFAALPKAGTQPIDVEALTAQLMAKVAPSLEAVEEVATQKAITEIKHPGWRKTVNTTEFKSWYAAQPATVKALAASDAAADAVSLLDKFKENAARAQQQNRNKSRLDNAVAPKGQSTGGPPVPNERAALHRGFKRVRPT